MNTNNNQIVTSFLRLKNDKGEDVYSIDKLGDALVVSPMKLANDINIFDTLTVYSENTENICKVNMSEIFINALYDALEKNHLYGEADILSRLMEDSATVKDVYKAFNDSKIVFRESNESFPDRKNYEPPNSAKLLEQLGRIENLLGVKNDNKPYVRETSKVGANDLCPCGSGLKYKKCCRDKENSNVG